MEQKPHDVIADDDRAFLRWQRQFERRCGKRGHLDNAVAGARLLACLEDLEERSAAWLPEVLIVAGFTRHTPLQQALLEKLAALGVRLVPMAFPNCAGRIGKVVRCEAADPEDELHRAASWCRERLLRGGGGGGGDGGGAIGVVVSSLDKHREAASRIFEQVLGGFDPAPDTVAAARLFHLSLGAPLAQAPVVAAALELLEWLSGEAGFETFSRSLRSPFLGGAEAEQVARARFDRVLRKTVAARLSPAQLGRALGLAPVKAAAPPQWSAILAGLLKAVREAPARQSPAAWSETFNQWLALAGWPGERALNSHEYQALKAWSEAQEQFASLSLFESGVGVRRAWLQLMQIAARRIFNPDAVPAPVQVMGVEESAGLSFDALWVTGLSDAAWPPPPSPQPFLPVAEQRRLGMPEAAWEPALEQARATVERLAAAAPEVVFSHPARGEDRELGPSALIAGRQAATPLAPEQIVLRPAASGAAVGLLERIADGKGSGAADGARISGGAGLFKDQSACPFLGFARHRLGSETIQPARAAFDAMDHGSMVHDALERLWNDWDGEQRRLQAVAPQQLQQQIGAALDAVLARYQRRSPGVMSDAARALQKAFLLQTLCAFLEYEKARPPFRVIVREQKEERNFHGLGLRVRMDRVDQVNGKTLLIDYKTGDARASAWFKERPPEPQLPLYRVLLGGDDVAGVAFARVRPDPDKGFYFDGVCDDGWEETSGLWPVAALRAAKSEGIPDWQALNEHWDEVLAGLARAIANGEAAVAPRPDACRFCDQRMLCRIDERNRRSGDGAGDVDGTDDAEQGDDNG